MGLLDAGAKALAAVLCTSSRSKLRELRLGGNAIGDEGVAALAAVIAMPSCRLRRLSLSGNAISDLGAQALAKALAGNTVLEELDLWGNHLTDEGKKAIIGVAHCSVFLELDPPHRELVRSAVWPVPPQTFTMLFDWISQVHIGVQSPSAFDGSPDPQDMLFRVLAHVDAFIASAGVAGRNGMQVVGVACTLVAAGLHRGSAFDRDEMAAWLTFVTDGACTTDLVLDTVDRVRETLGFRLHQPTAYTFLRRFLRWTGWSEESFSLANYMIELAITCGLSRKFPPQAVAAAAALLSRRYSTQGVGVPTMPRWKTKLLRCAQIDVRRVWAPCTSALAQLHASNCRNAALFVNRKYSWHRFHGVSRIRPNIPFDSEFYAKYLEAE